MIEDLQNQIKDINDKASQPEKPVDNDEKEFDTEIIERKERSVC